MKLHLHFSASNQSLMCQLMPLPQQSALRQSVSQPPDVSPQQQLTPIDLGQLKVHLKHAQSQVRHQSTPQLTQPSLHRSHQSHQSHRSHQDLQSTSTDQPTKWSACPSQQITQLPRNQHQPSPALCEPMPLHTLS